MSDSDSSSLDLDLDSDTDQLQPVSRSIVSSFDRHVTPSLLASITHHAEPSAVTSIALNLTGRLRTLQNLSACLAPYANIRVLDLARNAITALPDLSFLKHLETLDVSSNDLLVLDVPCLNIVEIDASRNKRLHRISSNLHKCTRLRTLRLHGCNIEDAKSSIDHLNAVGALRILDLYDNPIVQRLGDTYAATVVATVDQLDVLDGESTFRIRESAVFADLDAKRRDAQPEETPTKKVRKKLPTSRPANAGSVDSSVRVRSASSTSSSTEAMLHQQISDLMGKVKELERENMDLRTLTSQRGRDRARALQDAILDELETDPVPAFDISNISASVNPNLSHVHIPVNYRDASCQVYIPSSAIASSLSSSAVPAVVPVPPVETPTLPHVRPISVVNCLVQTDEQSVVPGADDSEELVFLRELVEHLSKRVEMDAQLESPRQMSEDLRLDVESLLIERNFYASECERLQSTVEMLSSMLAAAPSPYGADSAHGIISILESETRRLRRLVLAYRSSTGQVIDETLLETAHAPVGKVLEADPLSIRLAVVEIACQTGSVEHASVAVQALPTLTLTSSAFQTAPRLSQADGTQTDFVGSDSGEADCTSIGISTEFIVLDSSLVQVVADSESKAISSSSVTHTVATETQPVSRADAFVTANLDRPVKVSSIGVQWFGSQSAISILGESVHVVADLPPSSLRTDGSSVASQTDPSSVVVPDCSVDQSSSSQQRSLSSTASQTPARLSEKSVTCLSTAMQTQPSLASSAIQTVQWSLWSTKSQTDPWPVQSHISASPTVEARPSRDSSSSTSDDIFSSSSACQTQQPMESVSVQVSGLPDALRRSTVSTSTEQNLSSITAQTVHVVSTSTGFQTEAIGARGPHQDYSASSVFTHTDASYSAACPSTAVAPRSLLVSDSVQTENPLSTKGSQTISMSHVCATQTVSSASSNACQTVQDATAISCQTFHDVNSISAQTSSEVFSISCQTDFVSVRSVSPPVHAVENSQLHSRVPLQSLSVGVADHCDILPVSVRTSDSSCQTPLTKFSSAAIQAFTPKEYFASSSVQTSNVVRSVGSTQTVYPEWTSSRVRQSSVGTDMVLSVEHCERANMASQATIPSPRTLCLAASCQTDLLFNVADGGLPPTAKHVITSSSHHSSSSSVGVQAQLRRTLLEEDVMIADMEGTCVAVRASSSCQASAVSSSNATQTNDSRRNAHMVDAGGLEETSILPVACHEAALQTDVHVVRAIAVQASLDPVVVIPAKLSKAVAVQAAPVLPRTKDGSCLTNVRVSNVAVQSVKELMFDASMVTDIALPHLVALTDFDTEIAEAQRTLAQLTTAIATAQHQLSQDTVYLSQRQRDIAAEQEILRALVERRKRLEREIEAQNRTQHSLQTPVQPALPTPQVRIASTSTSTSTYVQTPAPSSIQDASSSMRSTPLLPSHKRRVLGSHVEVLLDQYPEVKKSPEKSPPASARVEEVSIRHVHHYHYEPPRPSVTIPPLQMVDAESVQRMVTESPFLSARKRR